MIAMQFYPKDSIVPKGVRTEEFHLRPLRVTDAEIDYAALMDSKLALRIMSQSEWPHDEFTLEMNKRDLEEHEKEHDEGIAFTYTVLDPTETICLGCVYITPLKEGPMMGDYMARLRFWVRQPYLDGDLDRRLLRSLVDWLRNDWRFSYVVLTLADADERQNMVAKSLGLQLVHAFGDKWSEYLIKSGE